MAEDAAKIDAGAMADASATAVADTLAVYQGLFEDRLAGAAAIVENALPGGAR